MEINVSNVISDTSSNEGSNRQTTSHRYTITRKEDFQIVNGFFWEFLGTFLISYGYLSARTALPSTIVPTELLNSSQFGVAMCVGIAAAFGLQQTGAHYNPAISINYTLEKRINIVQLIFYIFGQLLGAMTAGFFYYILNSEDLKDPVKVPSLNMNHQIQFFFQEMTGTFLLGLFYNIQTHSYCKFTDDFFMIALDFFCAILTARTLSRNTGGILNPAIATAILLDTGILYDQFEGGKIIWIYIVAPICGSVANFFFFTYFYAPLYQKLLRYQAAARKQ